MVQIRLLTEEQWLRALSLAPRSIGIIPEDTTTYRPIDAFPHLFRKQPTKRAQVLELWLMGLGSRSIASVLNMNYKTEQTHLRRLKRAHPAMQQRGEFISELLYKTNSMVPIVRRDPIPSREKFRRRDWERLKFFADKKHYQDTLGLVWYKSGLWTKEGYNKIKTEQAMRREKRKHARRAQKEADALALSFGLDIPTRNTTKQNQD